MTFKGDARDSSEIQEESERDTSLRGDRSL